MEEEEDLSVHDVTQDVVNCWSMLVRAFPHCSAWLLKQIELLARDRENRPRLQVLRVDEVILAALEAFGKTDQEIASTGLLALMHLIDNNATRLVTLGAGNLTIKLMRAWNATSVKVARYGLGLIAGLAKAPNSDVFLTSGSCEVIVAAIKRYYDTDLTVAIVGCKTIGEIARNLRLTEILVHAKATEAFAKVFVPLCKKDPSAAILYGTRAIGSLAMQSSTGADLLISLGVCDALIDTVTTSGPSHMKIALNGLYLISKLAQVTQFRTDERVKAVACMVSVVLEAVTSTDVEVASCACLILSIILQHRLDAALAMTIAELAGVGLVGMLNSVKDESIATYGCLTLASLAGLGEAVVNVLLDQGAGRVVVNCLNDFGTVNLDVAQYGCSAISLMINEDSGSRMHAAGTGDAVLRTAAAFGAEYQRVALPACSALLQLEMCSSFRLDGLGIVKSMRTNQVKKELLVRHASDIAPPANNKRKRKKLVAVETAGEEVNNLLEQVL